jgi:LytR cell envelope-related transcriptional attenuator
VADPSEHDRQQSGGRGGRDGGIPVFRALAVLILFVAATVLILGEIHPGGTAATTATSTPTTTATTATTKPAAKHSASTTTTTIPPSKVVVMVANGSEVNGAAAAVTAKLRPGGWDLLTPTNAATSVTATQIYYVAGYEKSAIAIATSLQLPTSVVAPYTTAAPITSIGSALVAVVVGPDLADKASTTTTTAAG